MVTFWPLIRYKTVQFENGEEFHYKYYDTISLFNNLTIDKLKYDPVVKTGGFNSIEMTIHNPYNIDIDLTKKYSTVLWELYYFTLDKERHSGVSIEKVKLKTLKANSSETITAYFKSDSIPGKYTIGAAIRPYKLFPISVSKRTYPIEVIRE